MATGKGRTLSIGMGNPNREPTPTTRTRASTRNTVSLLLTKDEIMQQEFDVKDKESGLTFLEKSPFWQPGEPLSNESLLLTILHITQYPGIPRTAVEGLRAVALLLESSPPPTTPDETLQQFKDHLTSSLTEHVIAAISPQIASILTASESLKANALEIAQMKKTIEDNQPDSDASKAASRAEEAADAVLSSITDVKNAIEILAPSLNATQDSINKISSSITDSSNQTINQQPAKTYSAAAQQQAPTPIPVSAALLRAATRDRQILFDPAPGQTLFATDIISADLAAKIKQAMLTAKTDDSPDIQIKATTRLHNGGIIVELTTSEAAQWVRIPENRLKIISALDVPVSIKERQFSVIVPFLPITSEIEEPEWHRAVEEENGLPIGVLESAGWIKPRIRRAPAQSVAHAIFRFADPDAANISLCDGIYIGQEKFHPRKDKREPVRCVRCQRWGHIAKDCKAPHDTCGTCGKNHRTNDCNSYKTFHCVSCNSHDHASWDRNCPEFENRCAGIDAKLPENSMPYFPTNITWTQVMLPPKPAPYHKPETQQPPNQSRPPFRQTTIQFNPSRTNPPPRRRQVQTVTPTGPNAIPTPNREPNERYPINKRNGQAPTPTNPNTPSNTTPPTVSPPSSSPRNPRNPTPTNV